MNQNTCAGSSQCNSAHAHAYRVKSQDFHVGGHYPHRPKPLSKHSTYLVDSKFKPSPHIQHACTHKQVLHHTCSTPHTFHTQAAPAFSRPVRWLVAMHGAAELPFSALGLTAGRVRWVWKFVCGGVGNTGCPALFRAWPSSPPCQVCGSLWGNAFLVVNTLRTALNHGSEFRVSGYFRNLR